MSIDVDDRRASRARGEVVAFSVAFVLLLATAIIWPRPVLWINDATFRADLPISTVSFLGRGVPAWDVPYWALVGFAVLALFHGRLGAAEESWTVVRRELSGTGSRAAALMASLTRPATLVVGLVLAALSAVTWVVVDAPLLAQVSRVGSERVHDFVRLANRLGGGGNPPMVVGFFVLAGLALRRPRWTLLGVSMAVSAGLAGVLASVLKPLVGRARPDLWYGPFEHVWGGESSFPSGHAISAFAVAGAVFAGSRSKALRGVMLLAAISIATTRVVALRHWPSDVLVSAILGAAIGFFAGRAFVRPDAGSHVEVGEVHGDEP
jgi:undecaprenyl-diphosphatase